jgi:hypothetical protein
MLAALVPSRLHLLRPWRRGRGRRDVDGCVGRCVSRPDYIPIRQSWLRMAFTGQDIARPVRVTARCADCRCRDGSRREGNGRRRDRDGQVAKKPRHSRPLSGPVPDVGRAPAYVLDARWCRQTGSRRELGHLRAESGRLRVIAALVDDSGHYIRTVTSIAARLTCGTTPLTGTA